MTSSRFLKLLDEMEDIHRRKNAGYAGENPPDPWSNFRMAEMLDVSAFNGCLVRMGDKFARVCNLAKNQANDKVGENIKDTLMDLAIYSLIGICLYEEQEAMDESIEYINEKFANMKISDFDREYRNDDPNYIGKHAQVVENGVDLGVGVIISKSLTRAIVRFEFGAILDVNLNNVTILD
jgi:hypothetical protein